MFEFIQNDFHPEIRHLIKGAQKYIDWLVNKKVSEYENLCVNAILHHLYDFLTPTYQDKETGVYRQNYEIFMEIVHRDLKKAIDLEPHNPKAYIIYGEILIMRDKKAAATYLEKGLEHTNNFWHCLELEELFSMIYDLDNDIKTLEKQRKIAALNPEFHSHLERINKQLIHIKKLKEEGKQELEGGTKT